MFGNNYNPIKKKMFLIDNRYEFKAYRMYLLNTQKKHNHLYFYIHILYLYKMLFIYTTKT